jgi:hypothetical protein
LKEIRGGRGRFVVPTSAHMNPVCASNLHTHDTRTHAGTHKHTRAHSHVKVHLHLILRTHVHTRMQDYKITQTLHLTNTNTHTPAHRRKRVSMCIRP